GNTLYTGSSMIDVTEYTLWAQSDKNKSKSWVSSNDASIYNGSELKEGLESPNNIFNLPEEKSLP
ncbi:hypothetical protein JOQ06_020029, partial [Pogonophryne albipinna]